MALDEATIKSLAREECGQPPIEEVSDNLVDSFYTDACIEVNIVLGRTVARIGEIETEALEQQYELPGDCVKVIELFWGPEIPTVTPTSRMLREPFDFAANELGEELQAARRRRLDKFPYQWDVMNFGEGTRLVIGYVPDTGGRIIKFRYIAAVTDDTSIPDALAEALKEKVKFGIFRTRHAYWASHDELTQSAELRQARTDEFMRGAETCEKRYKDLLISRQ